jgi:hypothetical protein
MTAEESQINNSYFSAHHGTEPMLKAQLLNGLDSSDTDVI